MPTPTLAPVTVYGTWPPEPSGWGGAGGMWDWNLYSRPEWDWLMGWDWGGWGYPIEDPDPPSEVLDFTVAVEDPTPEAAPAPIVDPAPVPSNWGGPALESGLWDVDHGLYYVAGPPSSPPIWGDARYLDSVIKGKEDYYAFHYGEESRHYRDPTSSSGLAASAVNAIVPETGHLLKHIGTLLQHNLDEQAFKVLKWMSRKNYAFIQGVFSWNAIQKDIAAGTPPKVAIGSEAALLVFNYLVAEGISFAVLGSLGIAAAGPVVAASVVIGAGVAFGSDLIGVKSIAAKLINDALFNVDPQLIEPPSAAGANFLQHGEGSALPSLAEDMSAYPSPLFLEDGVVQFSDYQIYLAMREIVEHPDRYPDAVALLPGILASIAGTIDSEDVAGIDLAGENVSMRTPPETVRYADITPDNGVKTFAGGNERSYLFIGDDTPNKMIGGKAINWFMPKADHGGANTIIGSPDGYNVLDFSLNEKGVDIFIQDNDRMEKWILDRAYALGIDPGRIYDHFLTYGNALTLLRGWFASEELNSGSCARLSDDIYKNIDYIIGSSYDDIIVGDMLGGVTMTGGAGNDTFVLHGGGNRVIFNDGDFASPGSGEITTKFVHGLTTGSEADDFNARHYAPQYLNLGGHFGFRLDPDVLDFSNLDGDVNVDGYQAMRFIGEHAFTGHAGEVRYVTHISHGSNIPDQTVGDEGGYFWTTVRLEGDRTGSGEADFFVEYTNYLNPSNDNSLWSEYATGNIYPFLDDANLFFG